MLHYFHRVNKGIQRSNIIAVTGKGCSLSGLFDFCRTGLNRPGETGLNRQVSAGRNRQKLAET